MQVSTPPNSLAFKTGVIFVEHPLHIGTILRLIDGGLLLIYRLVTPLPTDS